MGEFLVHGVEVTLYLPCGAGSKANGEKEETIICLEIYEHSKFLNGKNLFIGNFFINLIT